MSRREFLGHAAAVVRTGALGLALAALLPGDQPAPDIRQDAATLLAVGGVPVQCEHYWYLRSAVGLIQTALPKRQARLVETAGSAANLERLRAGELALAFTSADLAYQAFHGRDAWRGPAFDTLRLLWYFASSPLVHLVREDSGIRALSELAGKLFIPGARFSDASRVAKQALEAIGVRPDWRETERLEVAAAVARGEALGFSWPIPATAIDPVVAHAAPTASATWGSRW